MRIAIVNDVPMAVEAMRRVVVDGGGHQLAWVAQDGAEAVDACIRNRPDVVLMDLIMPKVDGIEATRQIMANAPCAIVVVTADMNENQGKVFEAMGAGALDVVNTPVLYSSGTCKGAQALLAKIDTIGKLVGAIDLGHRRPAARSVSLRRPDCLVAIGASAGGPAALAHILQRLPAGFSGPMVIIQHVDPQFAPGLASWLNQHTVLTVRLAREGDWLEAGTVLLADGDQHLVFKGPGRLGYIREPMDSAYSPSVDVFFRSIDRFWEGRTVGVLLTGMGRDGAEGLKMLRVAGHYTLVQDQATSAVYGMPKAAAELDAATEILPLEQIPSRLARLVGRAEREPHLIPHD